MFASERHGASRWSRAATALLVSRRVASVSKPRGLAATAKQWHKGEWYRASYLGNTVARIWPMIESLLM